jgi:phage-related protein
VLGVDIKKLEFSWPIGMPFVGSLGRELWEVRSSLPRSRIARVLFCVEQGGMVLLHGFIKKTRETPQREIDLTLKRKKRVMKKKNIGSSFDSWLGEEGIREEVTATAIKRIRFTGGSRHEGEELFQARNGAKDAHQPRCVRPSA